jgi:hypothetical protein
MVQERVAPRIRTDEIPVIRLKHSRAPGLKRAAYCTYG